MRATEPQNPFMTFFKFGFKLVIFFVILLGVIHATLAIITHNEFLYEKPLINYLNEKYKKDIQVSSLQGKWTGFGPEFKIKGVTDQQDLNIKSATLGLNIYQYLIPQGLTGINLVVDDADVEVIKNQDGAIELTSKSEKLKQSFSKRIDKLLNTGSFSVENILLKFEDQSKQLQSEFNATMALQTKDDNKLLYLALDENDILGSIKLTAQCESELDFLTQAQWHANFENLTLQNLNPYLNEVKLPKLNVSSELWVTTEQNNIKNLTAKTEFNNFNAKNLNPFSGVADIVFSGNKNNWDSSFSLVESSENQLDSKEIVIDAKRIGQKLFFKSKTINLKTLIKLLSSLEVIPDMLIETEVSGTLNELSFVYDYNLKEITNGTALFNNLDLSSDAGFIKNLSGEIKFEKNQIKLLVDSQDGEGQYHKMTRDIIQWNQLSINLETSIDSNFKDFKIRSLYCDCIDMIANASGRINNQSDLFIDVGLRLKEAKINQLYKYWPANIWKPNLLNFLDSALVEGNISNGFVSYAGFTKDFPFPDSKGVFLARAYLQSTTIKYQDQWPVLYDFDAITDFKNHSMSIKSNSGKVMDAGLTQVIADISSFKKPLLNVTSKANGDNNFLVDILRKSPLSNDIKVIHEDIDIQKHHGIHLDLSIPLYLKNQKFEPTGKIIFKENDFKLNQFQLDDLTGNIDFSGYNLNLNEVTANFFEAPVEISGTVLPDSNNNTTLDLFINGDYTVEKIEKILNFELPAKGTSSWQFNISNANSEEINFEATSNLNGIGIQMPAPIYKENNIDSPFSIKCVLPCEDGNVSIDYGEIISAELNLEPEKTLALTQLIFGMEQNNSSAFGGSIDKFDLDQWLNYLPEESTTDSKIPFDNIDLKIDNLIFMNRNLINVNLKVISNDEGLKFIIDGQDVLGTIEIPNKATNRGIIIQLDKLHWQETDDDVQLTTQLTQTSSKANNYPALHIWIKDFIYGGIPLGDTRIEARNTANGFRIEKFTTKAEDLQLNINGTYDKNHGENGLSKFNIILISHDLAAFLNDMGFQAPLKDAATVINMQVEWPDTPGAFEVSNMNGKMRIEIGKGQVVDAKPGVGRVLGLFNLTNLPRRLLLDFKDVFSEGLIFNSMQGDFELVDGEAFTENFKIDSSSAVITITGKTGLASKNYDQTIVVTPRVGRALPTIGAIAGGAVGAAAGFLVQNLFRKGLKNIGKIVYQVTGNWDNPKIELVEAVEKNKRNEK